jgi:hypothetical protein
MYFIFTGPKNVCQGEKCCNPDCNSLFCTTSHRWNFMNASTKMEEAASQILFSMIAFERNPTQVPQNMDIEYMRDMFHIQAIKIVDTFNNFLVNAKYNQQLHSVKKTKVLKITSKNFSLTIY